MKLSLLIKKKNDEEAYNAQRVERYHLLKSANDTEMQKQIAAARLQFEKDEITFEQFMERFKAIKQDYAMKTKENELLNGREFSLYRPMFGKLAESKVNLTNKQLIELLNEQEQKKWKTGARWYIAAGVETFKKQGTCCVLYLFDLNRKKPSIILAAIETPEIPPQTSERKNSPQTPEEIEEDWNRRKDEALLKLRSINWFETYIHAKEDDGIFCMAPEQFGQSFKIPTKIMTTLKEHFDKFDVDEHHPENYSTEIDECEPPKTSSKNGKDF